MNARRLTCCGAASIVAAAAPLLLVSPSRAATAGESHQAEAALSVVAARRVGPTGIEFELSGQRHMTLDFYGEGIFRWFRDDQGGAIRDPEADPVAKILVDEPRAKVAEPGLEEQDGRFIVTTAALRVEIEKGSARLKVIRTADGKVLVEQAGDLRMDKNQVTLTLAAEPDEYFYGGGVQNGHFSHRGRSIAIENQNRWTDGGVASPNPFYWSTRGYGLMWHTFKKGRYDFGSDDRGRVELSHQTGYLDVFIIAGKSPGELLGGYFQLTGKPVLLPKFGFYLGHLNAYNRDYWKEDEEAGVLFEDGKRYKESQKDNGGIKESLNGEKDNYPFSARAVIDRYAAADMPLGWLLPNDGYGAGYGQTDTLEGNVANLREFGDYARKHGVEIGLWTQSDLHPDPEVSALLQRDLVREVRDAGVRVLKTDVAWVGAGYSFGLNGIADAAGMMTDHGDNSRPFIITLDGWAGTQRYAGVWTGDQTGGQWEYIRFHLPTYIGAGLSGMSNICSDMDGIFGGKNPVINTRDYQWKTFTSMQLNMDGWGANPKYPQALGEPATSINRWYLKMKSELMPYTYSIARQAVDGLPMVRAMFLGEANAYTLGTASRYQFLYGPSFLVAPIYQDTRSDEDGNDVRDNIYLPEGEWIDWFSGDRYQGGRVINGYDSPLWKLPVFVKRGAIIPKAAPHNHVGEIDRAERLYEFYPSGKSSFTDYDDDGRTERYKQGAATTTAIESELDSGRAVIRIEPTQGSFDGFVKDKFTGLQVNVTARPAAITAKVNGETVALTEAPSLEALHTGENVYFYEAAPNLNRFATPGSGMADLVVTRNPVVHLRLGKLDTTRSRIEVILDGYRYDPAPPLLATSGPLAAPVASIRDEDRGPYSLTPGWQAVKNADYYEIEYDGVLYSTIREQRFLIGDLEPETGYSFKVRAVNKDGASAWTDFAGSTLPNPYEFAIEGIAGKSSAPDQGGSAIKNLFDHDPSNLWHTKWGREAVPFEFVVDLRSVNTLDKLQYLPREDAANGTLLEGSIFHSMDGSEWTKAGDFTWERNGDTKEFAFQDTPQAAYLKFEITAAVGNFGSGRELYVFKVPGSESYIPGDINEDKRIDANDLTSYDNYTGLRKGDADFEGYISKGDINGNDLIDAYDISRVATRLEGGAEPDPEAKPLAGELVLDLAKHDYKAGESIRITVAGKDLESVNALSFALPYDAGDLSFAGIEAPGMKSMQEFTKDRLHTDGSKALYPTFVNVGDQETLAGSGELFVIKFTANRDLHLELKPRDGLLVGKSLASKALWAE
ncbi:TIM-barrel domain-containing protein [Luteolibacter marinus]|uniref:TIM-barrel domain-containing protein n=1 Tax=Luteolibacter marinus TaxID=2776705 RepID=UPI0018687B81|nr:TIM-barrel domain-containing protein [Luteolibacter marinus]